MIQFPITVFNFSHLLDFSKAMRAVVKESVSGVSKTMVLWVSDETMAFPNFVMSDFPFSIF